MKKILLFLLINFLLISKIFAIDDVLEITKVSYNWNLSNDTIINLSWKNFINCTNITIDDKIIPIKLVNSTKIDFSFSDLNLYSWSFLLNCWWKKYSYNFSFPYIYKWNYNIWSLERKIEIEWFNLDNWSLVVNWWSFSKDNWSIYNIVWKLPESLTSNEVYVNAWNLKSNILNLDLKIPKIDFIYSEEWINEWNDIYIYWSNLNYYKNSAIFLWDTKINELYVLENWNILKFNTRWYSWKYDLYINSNWFKSNILKLYIYWKKPFVKNVAVESIEWIWKQLYIYWENFSKELLNNEVYINSKKVTIWKITDWYISIPSFSLNPWINSIVVYSNWFYSNTYSYIDTNNTPPEITSLDIWSIFDGIRVVNLYIRWYLTWDKIYLNWAVINPISCDYSTCKVELDKKILKWEFRVWRGDYKSKNIKFFDFTKDYKPYITSIKVIGKLEKGYDIEIYWKNFYDSTVTVSNLFSKTDKWQLDIEISDWLIKWRISNDYDNSKNTTINISKYWLNYSYSFSKAQLNNLNIFPWAYILDAKSNNYIFKEWSVITLEWWWFKNGDIVDIWWQKTLLDYKTKTFIVPSWVKKWLSDIFIEWIDKQKSNNFKVFLYSSSETSDIKVISKDLINSSFEINKWINLKELVYKAEINNNVDSLYIDNVEFNLFWLKDNLLFSLYLDSTYIWDAYSSWNWKLLFDNWFIIPSISWTKNLILYANSPFLNQWEIDISLTNIKWKFNNYSKVEPKFILPILSTKIYIKNSDLNNCLDSDIKRLNCNSFMQNKNNIYNNSLWSEKDIEKELKNINDNSVDYSSLINKSKSLSTKNLIIARDNLSKTGKWKSYISQLDVAIPLMEDDKMYSILKNVQSTKNTFLSRNSIKNSDILFLLDFMESRIEVELLK